MLITQQYMTLQNVLRTLRLQSILSIQALLLLQSLSILKTEVVALSCAHCSTHEESIIFWCEKFMLMDALEHVC